MTEALFFYRTPTTRILDVADPHNLPATQTLLFDLPKNVYEAVEEFYRNNNKKFPIPTAKGVVKKIGVSPAGMKGYGRTIRGYFKDSATLSISRLRAFRKIGQIDTYHEFGVFGVEFPTDAVEFNVDGDPDNTFGWTLDEYRLKNLSAFSNKVYDFVIDIGFGGTLP